MIALKVTCNTGNSWNTRFNGTYEEAENYFLGTVFTSEEDDGTEHKERCIGIALIAPVQTTQMEEPVCA